MEMSIRRYKVDPTIVDELVRRTEEKFSPIVSTVAGFIAYHVVDAGDGIVATVTMCCDEEGIAESNQRAQEYVETYLVDLLPKLSEAEITMGAVRMSKVA